MLEGYLRKTARGASSPAKPALHIPELIHVSIGAQCPRYVGDDLELPGWQLCLRARNRATGGQVGEGRRSLPIVDNESSNLFCKWGARISDRP